MSHSNTSAASWAEWFDRSAKHYKDPMMKMAYYLDGQTGTPVSLEVMQATSRDIWNKLMTQPQHTVLDVGCGVGLFIKEYAARAKNIIGTDTSLQMIKAAQKNNPRNDFFVCAADQLPFNDRQFDRLLCYGVFHYLPDEKTVKHTVAEFVRVVKPDGLIVIGDVLAETSPFSGPSAPKKVTRWWPAQLNHRLTKFKLPPNFFLDYCREKNYPCEILEQHIPGRILPDSRYDVRIRVKK